MEAIKTVKLTKTYKDLTAVDQLDLAVEQENYFLYLVSTVPEKQPPLKCFPA